MVTIKAGKSAIISAAALLTCIVSTVTATAQQAEKNFDGREIVVQTFGGTVASYFRNVIGKEFGSKFNAKVVVTEGLSVDTVAKLRATKGDPEFDIWVVSESWSPLLERESLLEPLSAASMPALQEIETSARRPNNAYFNFSRAGMTITYNTDKLKEADLPRTWNELADPRFKGRLILPAANNVHAIMLMLELAYDKGGGLDNIEPGFAALKDIAPNVATYFTSYDQNFNLLNSGQAWIAVTSIDRSIDQVLKGAPVRTYYPDQGTVFISNSIGVSKGSKQKEVAEAFLNFLLSKDIQKGIADKLGFLPVRADVDIVPAVKAQLPQGKALENSLIPNWEQITNKQAAWIERYTKEVVSK
jgi:spermidine/putrescine-binding protein